jgi:hypothetical protein
VPKALAPGAVKRALNRGSCTFPGSYGSKLQKNAGRSAPPCLATLPPGIYVVTQPQPVLFAKPSFLERAEAYQAAVASGEPPGEVAAKARVHQRTVLRYLRLAKMPEQAKYLVNRHPELFTTTWASRLTRRGPLPNDAVLIKEMQQMVTNGRVWFPDDGPKRLGREKKHAPKATKRSVAQWRTLLDRPDVRDLSQFTYAFLAALKDEGYIRPDQWKSILCAVWPKI